MQTINSARLLCVPCLCRRDGDRESAQEALPGHHQYAVRRLQPVRAQFLVRCSLPIYVPNALTSLTAFDGLKVLTQLLFPSAILPICWTEASAASAPPPTPQGRWKACRPPRPATPLSLVCRICRQSEDETERSLSPGKLFGSPAAALRGLVSEWGGGPTAAY